MHVPDIARLLIVFAAMLALNRAGLTLGVALVFGGIALDLWSGTGLADAARHMGVSAIDPSLWLLGAVTALLLIYAVYLGSPRNAGALLAAARRWGGRHGRAFSLAVMPAAIGFVPMPGGALVSAPLVNKALPEPHWEPAWKSIVNYWFRHVWEYWWPMFPVVIVSMSIFHVPVWQFIATLFPYSIVTLGTGYFFLLRPHLNSLAREHAQAETGDGSLRPMVLSLGTVVACAVLLPRVITPWTGAQHAKEIAMTLGMAAGLAIMALADRSQSLLRAATELKKPKAFTQISTLCGVVVFQSLLDQCGILPRASAELAGSGIPLPAVVALLPLLAGVITGIATGFAGLAFPLVVGLMHANAETLPPLATLALAFGFGYAGMMLSPVHLCLILTRDYYQAGWLALYRQLWPCVATSMAASVLLFVGLRTAGW